RIEASLPWDFVEQLKDLFLTPGAVGKRSEQPIREVDLTIASHFESPISGRSPVQMHGHFG
ncbi:MAG: hypothetical protein IKX19_13285, partial [Clostridia bacterium]|nr:hypothetical protein [Clostridia bacterium]